jgi:hypothetical protein
MARQPGSADPQKYGFENYTFVTSGRAVAWDA